MRVIEYYSIHLINSFCTCVSINVSLSNERAGSTVTPIYKLCLRDVIIYLVTNQITFYVSNFLRFLSVFGAQSGERKTPKERVNVCI